MIELNIGSNMNSTTIIVSPDTTIRAAFEQAGINPGRGFTTLNTAPISPADFDRSLYDLGITGEVGKNKATLWSVLKADNA